MLKSLRSRSRQDLCSIGQHGGGLPLRATAISGCCGPKIRSLTIRDLLTSVSASSKSFFRCNNFAISSRVAAKSKDSALVPFCLTLKQLLSKSSASAAKVINSLDSLSSALCEPHCHRLIEGNATNWSSQYRHVIRSDDFHDSTWTSMS